MGKSSTRGASSLTVDLEGELLKDDDALNQVAKQFGTVSDDFSGVFYLHQEAIQEILSMDPKERSRGIDRLLGTYEIREFAEALDLDRYFNGKTKSLDKRLNEIGADKEKLASNLRKLVSEKKQKLISSGYDESELSVERCGADLSTIITDAMSLASKYDPSPPKIKYPVPQVEQIRDAADALSKYLRELNERRLKRVAELDKKIGTINRSKTTYEAARMELESIGQITLDSVDASRKDVLSQLQDIEPKVRELDKLVTNLIAMRSEVSTTKQNIDRARSKSSEIVNKYGDLERLRLDLEAEGRKLEDVRHSIDSSSKLGQLLVVGLNYLSSERSHECPICQQLIDVEKVIRSLEDRNKNDLSQKIASLEAETYWCRKKDQRDENNQGRTRPTWNKAKF